MNETTAATVEAGERTQFVLDREDYTKAEIKTILLDEMGWSRRGRRRTMWSNGRFRDLTLREAASLEGLTSCENLTEVSA